MYSIVTQRTLAANNGEVCQSLISVVVLGHSWDFRIESIGQRLSNGGMLFVVNEGCTAANRGMEISKMTRNHLHLLPLSALVVSGLLGTMGCPGGATTGSDGTDPVDRTVYPSAPYGLVEGDTLENLAFETSEGTAFDLEDIYSDPNNKLLLLSTAAGWCAACRDEQPALQALHETHEADGLFMLVTVAEDNNRAPADTSFVSGWINEYSLTFQVLLDEGFQMGDYYDETLTPMIMMVDLDTMEIISIATGFDQSSVDAIISARL